MTFRPSVRQLQWMIVVLLVAGGVSFIAKGANQPADPYLEAAARRPVEGFGEIAYRVSHTAAMDRCALLAQTALQQARGLAGRSDFSGFDGMLFVFPADMTADLPASGVAVPLSVAFFDAGGRFLSTTEVAPCPENADCPRIEAPGPYRYVLAMERGGLSSAGVGPGAVISVGGPCA